MALPLIELNPIALNARVTSLAVGSEEEPRRTPEGCSAAPRPWMN